MPPAFDPAGRHVVLPSRVINKILRGHPEMEDHIDEILVAVAHPDHQERDQYRDARRERYFRNGVGPGGWLRVVVEFEGVQAAEGVVVTAFAQDEDPR